MLVFDLLQLSEQSQWLQLGRNAQRRVDIIGLILRADRRTAIQRGEGNFGYARQGRDFQSGPVDMIDRVFEIAAQAYISLDS